MLQLFFKLKILLKTLSKENDQNLLNQQQQEQFNHDQINNAVTQPINSKQTSSDVNDKTVTITASKNQEYETIIYEDSLKKPQSNRLDKDQIYEVEPNNDEFEEILKQIYSNTKQKQKKNLKQERSEEFTLYQGYMAAKKRGYQIVRFIKQGGQGCVFQAKRSDEILALKIQCCEQFEDENSVIDSIKDPINIIKIEKKFFVGDNIQVLVMEYCEESLYDEMKRIKNYKFVEALTIIFDLLGGLIELRSLKIIHSDMKPSNILKNKLGKYQFTDYGSSRRKFSESQTIKAKSQSLGYSGPEQLNNEIDFSSDVFALGQVFLEVLQKVEEMKYKLEIDKFNMIISTQMKKNNIEDREDGIKLLVQFFEVINNIEFIEFNIKFIESVIRQVQKFPFDNTKDLKYFQNVHLTNNRIYLHIQLLFTSKPISLEQPFEQGIKNLSDTDKTIITILQFVGTSYYSVGNQAEALKYHEKVLDLCWKEDNYQKIKIQSLINVGSCEDSMGNYDKAFKHFTECLELCKQIGDTFYASISHNQIGYEYRQRGQYQLADTEYEKGIQLVDLEMKKDQSANRNYMLLKTTFLNNKGKTQQQLGKFQQSISLQQESLKLKDEIYQEMYTTVNEKVDRIQRQNHPDTAVTTNNLAITHQILGDVIQAYQLQNESYEMICAVFLNNHPIKAVLLNNFGVLKFENSSQSLGISQIQQSFEQTQKIYNFDHHAIAISLNNLGSCYGATKQLEMAEDYFRKSVTMIKKLFDKHPNLIIAKNNLSINLFKQNKFKESLEVIQNGVELGVELLPKDHLDLALLYYTYSGFLIEQGENQKANFYAQKAYQIVNENKEYTNDKVKGEYSKLLADSYYGQEEFDNSLKYYQISYEHENQYLKKHFSALQQFHKCKCLFHNKKVQQIYTNFEIEQQYYLNQIKNQTEMLEIVQKLYELYTDYLTKQQLAKQYIRQLNTSQQQSNLIQKLLQLFQIINQQENEFYNLCQTTQRFDNEPQQNQSDAEQKKIFSKLLRYFADIRKQLSNNQECLQIRMRINDRQSQLITIDYMRGLCSYYKKDYNQSIEYLSNSESLFNLFNDQNNQLPIFINAFSINRAIAKSYKKVQSFKLAALYYRIIIKTFENKQLSAFGSVKICMIYYKIAICKIQMQEFNAANTYLNKYQNYCERIRQQYIENGLNYFDQGLQGEDSIQKIFDLFLNYPSINIKHNEKLEDILNNLIINKKEIFLLNGNKTIARILVMRLKQLIESDQQKQFQHLTQYIERIEIILQNSELELSQLF